MTKTKTKRTKQPNQLQIHLLINGRSYVVRPLIPPAIGLDLLRDDGVRHQITPGAGVEGGWGCSCPDSFFRKKRGNGCKHLRAIKALRHLFNMGGNR